MECFKGVKRIRMYTTHVDTGKGGGRHSVSHHGAQSDTENVACGARKKFNRKIRKERKKSIKSDSARFYQHATRYARGHNDFR
jgi:carbonic anhydrase/acetyltransferase-like protein (isoleucine patch superfamily)